MKEWTLVGIPSVVTALAVLGKAEEEGNHKVTGALSAKWYICQL